MISICKQSRNINNFVIFHGFPLYIQTSGRATNKYQMHVKRSRANIMLNDPQRASAASQSCSPNTPRFINHESCRHKPPYTTKLSHKPIIIPTTNTHVTEIQYATRAPVYLVRAYLTTCLVGTSRFLRAWDAAGTSECACAHTLALLIAHGLAGTFISGDGNLMIGKSRWGKGGVSSVREGDADERPCTMNGRASAWRARDLRIILVTLCCNYISELPHREFHFYGQTFCSGT